MNTNYEMNCESIFETSPEALLRADAGLIGALELLAASGVGAEVVYDGDADSCPHCPSRVLSAAA